MHSLIKMIFGVALLSTQINFNLMATEAVGFFSKGELREGKSIMEINQKVHKLFVQRERFYSTEEMQEVISKTADWVKMVYPDAEKLQIGDLSHVYGGVVTGHSSHQNGLDVDAVYLTKNKKLQKQNAGHWQEEFVINGKISANFDSERNFELFKYLVHNHPVRRIFVDEVIKTNLCLYARDHNMLDKKEAKHMLKRLRIQKLHANHFHIRITCPVEDLECVEQVEVPSETGCESLITAFEMGETDAG